MASKGNILSRASKRFQKLVEIDIRKKNLIKTGDLIRSIDASFKEKNGEITITLGAIYYYTYLDDGTRYIKSRDITKDVLASPEFTKLMEETVVDITTIEIEKAFKGLGSKNIIIK